MKILNLQQGTQAWHDARAKHFTASEAPAMLGLSKYMTRDELLKQKATGIIPEVDPVKQKIFDKGHAAEAAARPFAEGVIGDELYPVTGSLEVDGLPLLASFDGLTESREHAWENKLFSKLLAGTIVDCEVGDHYWPQLEQQLLVSGADRVLFMASDGTEGNTVWVWYVSRSERRDQLLSGWHQFAEDLENYVHVDEKPTVIAEAVKSLPAVSIQVDGAIALTSNLSVFGEALEQYVGQINKEPETDQDFANLESVVKSLKTAEEALSAAENGALAQAVSIDDMRRTVELYRSMARDNRLIVEKLVKSEKENRRAKILQGGKDALAEHIAKQNELIGRPYMPSIPVDFVGVMKGKKTISSLQSAVNDELARAKIEANDISANIQTNMASLKELGADHKFLFTDAPQLVMKANDDLVSLIKVRISEYKEAEQEKIDAAAAEQLLQQVKNDAAAAEKLKQKAPATEEAPPADGDGDDLVVPVQEDTGKSSVVMTPKSEIANDTPTYSVKDPVSAACVDGEVVLSAFKCMGAISLEDAADLRDQLTQAIKSAIHAKNEGQE